MITLKPVHFDPPIEPTDSRFNAGILYLPRKWIDSQTEHGTPEERDPFIEELVKAMSEPLNEKDVQAHVPIVKIGLPDEESESKTNKQED